MTDRIEVFYEKCFNIKVSQQDKNWVPHVFCGSCYNMITRFEKHLNKSRLKFTIPTIWKEPLDKSDCYFCMTNVGSVNP